MEFCGASLGLPSRGSRTADVTGIQTVFQSHQPFSNLERVNLMKRHKTPLNNEGVLHLTPKTGGQVTPFVFMVMFGGQM